MRKQKQYKNKLDPHTIKIYSKVKSKKQNTITIVSNYITDVA